MSHKAPDAHCTHLPAHSAAGTGVCTPLCDMLKVTQLTGGCLDESSELLSHPTFKLLPLSEQTTVYQTSLGKATAGLENCSWQGNKLKKTPSQV